jgi:hypothetical protein
MQNKIRILLAAGLGIFLLFTSQVEAKTQKDWTMLVFLDGHNNLDQFGALNITQMEKVGSSDNLNIVVQWASQEASTTKRLLVQKSTAAGQVTSPVVQELPKVDMGSKQELLNFIEWGVQNYPAQHYFVVVWDHGSGWHIMSRLSSQTQLGARSLASTSIDAHVTDISWDDNTGHKITTEELGSVMHDAAQFIGHKVDLYGSDACLMSMVEVAQEMSGAVGVSVGSEETEPGEGWPYDTFLAAWAAKPGASAIEIGGMLVKAYGDRYVGQGASATMATMDMSKLPSLVDSLSSLKDKLVSVPNPADLQKIASSSVRFFDNGYVDIGNLMTNISKGMPGVAMSEIAEVQTQLKNVVTSNAASMAAQGISIWWPVDTNDWQNNQNRYLGLHFDKLAHWHDLLGKFF